MIAAGTQARPIGPRQEIEPPAPTRVAVRMPTPMAIWKHSTNRPR